MSVYLISGLGTPFILDDDPSRGVVVLRGDCYVEGIMRSSSKDLQYEYVKLV